MRAREPGNARMCAALQQYRDSVNVALQFGSCSASCWYRAVLRDPYYHRPRTRGPGRQWLVWGFPLARLRVYGTGVLPPLRCLLMNGFHLGWTPNKASLLSNANKQKPNKLSHVRAVLITSLPPCASKSFLQTSNNRVSRHVKPRPPGPCAADLGPRDLGARRVGCRLSFAALRLCRLCQTVACMYVLDWRTTQQMAHATIARSSERSRYLD